MRACFKEAPSWEETASDTPLILPSSCGGNTVLNRSERERGDGLSVVSQRWEVRGVWILFRVNRSRER